MARTAEKRASGANALSKLELVVKDIVDEMRQMPDRGEVASYIPELACVDPKSFGLVVIDDDGNTAAAGARESGAPAGGSPPAASRRAARSIPSSSSSANVASHATPLSTLVPSPSP